MGNKRVGIAFGCFIPLHIGHMEMIQRAVSENDLCIIGVCGYDNDRGKDFIPFKSRLYLMRKKYSGNPKVKIVKVDDKKLGLDGTFSSHNWEIWGRELFQNAHLNPDDKNTTYTWYTGEPSYVEKLGKIYTLHRFVLLNRSEVEISGTEIRSDPYRYQDNIDYVFYKYLKRKKII